MSTLQSILQNNMFFSHSLISASHLPGYCQFTSKGKHQLCSGFWCFFVFLLSVLFSQERRLSLSQRALSLDVYPELQPELNVVSLDPLENATWCLSMLR